MTRGGRKLHIEELQNLYSQDTVESLNLDE
jgi:hypothetical protein